MKIVYVLGGNYDASGMCSVITKKINWLAENTDWEITALLTESPNGRAFYFPLHESVRVVNFHLNYDELDTMPKLKKIFRYRQKQKRYRKMFEEWLMQERPDIVVSAMRREINFLTSFKDGSRKVGELHFCRQTYRVFSNPRLPGFVCRAITRYWQGQLLKQVRKLDAFVVLTEEDRKAWGDLPNMRVIPNFIQSLPEQPTDVGQKVVVAVGRYTEQKGFDLLFNAWQKVEQQDKEWKLMIFGAGERSHYQRLVDEMGLNRVRLNGTVKDVNEAFREGSLMVFSSRYEGFGMVLIEAMACGLPAVSFACPCGPRDIISDVEDGILVENGNTDALAEGLLQLMHDDERRKEMGERARNNMQRFMQEDVMLLWKRLLEEQMVKGR